eukprot:tig00020685_g12931.t1
MSYGGIGRELRSQCSAPTSLAWSVQAPPLGPRARRRWTFVQLPGCSASTRLRGSLCVRHPTRSRRRESAIPSALNARDSSSRSDPPPERVPEEKPARHRAIAEVDTFLAERHAPGRPVLLALSGGPDSLALFHALRLSEAMRRGRLELVCGHFDHGWRAESAAEAAAVAAACAAFGLRCRSARLPGPPPARDAERAAREARYAALRGWAAEEGAQAVLVAHQADEQAETVLKRLLEGADLSRISGMAPEAPFPFPAPPGAPPAPPLWRPLLAVPKAELEAFLVAVRAALPEPLRAHAAPAEDPSNADPRASPAPSPSPPRAPGSSPSTWRRGRRPTPPAPRPSPGRPPGGPRGAPSPHPLEARALLRALCAAAGARPSREALAAAAAALCAPPAPGRGGARRFDAGAGFLLLVRPGHLSLEPPPRGAGDEGGGSAAGSCTDSSGSWLY